MTAPSLAEIVAEGERQIANYQTMILPHGDARRLLAVAKAAVEMRSGVAVSMSRANGRWCEWGGRAEMVCDSLEENLAAFDAVASGAAGGKP